MTATVHQLFPSAYDEAEEERLDEALRLAEHAAWWGQQVRNARAALRSPDLYSDDELRDFCATLQSRWGDATDYCTADAMIFAINKREFIARNCPRPETPMEVVMQHMDRWPGLLLYAGIVVAAVWAGLSAWMGVL